MKNIKTIAVLAALGLALGAFAIAQTHHNRGGHHMPDHFKDATAAVGHLAEVFPKIASFDANKDGQLDATENQSIAKALAEGKVDLPHTHHGEALTAEVILNHVPAMYARIAPYDANHDGTLDSTEQASLKVDIEKGELDFPHGQHSNGGASRN